MASFILIHGTGHGGWCWKPVSSILRRAGHDVYSPTLTGLGASSHLLDDIKQITLGMHIKDVTNLLYYEDLSDVILVGHSYGGMVITGVASKATSRLSHLVYLDAYLPLDSENEIDLWPVEQKKRYYSDIEAGISFRPPMEPSILGISDLSSANWVKERLTPHPYSTYKDPHGNSTTESNLIPRTYIHCTDGPLSLWMSPFANRARDFGWNVKEIDSGHDVMITKPKELAQLLIQIAYPKG